MPDPPEILGKGAEAWNKWRKARADLDVNPG